MLKKPEERITEDVVVFVVEAAWDAYIPKPQTLAGYGGLDTRSLRSFSGPTVPFAHGTCDPCEIKVSG